MATCLKCYGAGRIRIERANGESGPCDVCSGTGADPTVKPSAEQALRTEFTKAMASGVLAAAEVVNHPPHYNRGGVEAIDVIEAWGLGFNLGNALKYLSRAGHKDPSKTVEDLEKAAWYINREKRRIALGRKDAPDR